MAGVAVRHNPWDGPAPLPEPPEKTAGMAEEITYLRSRGFAVTAGKGEFAGWWKVDGTYRSTEWVRDKVAGLKARKHRNAPAPVAVTGEAPVAIVSAVAPGIRDQQEIAPLPEPKVPAKRGPGKLPVDYRGLGEGFILDVLRQLRPHFASDAKLAAALGEWGNLLPAVFRGDRRVTAKIVAALYGPEGSTLLPRWQDLLNSQVPSESPPTCVLPADDAAANFARGEEAAAGDGAAASIDSETAGPGFEEAGSEALSSGPSTPAAEPGAARLGDQEAGEAQDAPASDLRDLLVLQIESTPGVPLPEWDGTSTIRAWPAAEIADGCSISDEVLLQILRGKAAALAAQLAEAGARREALFAELAELHDRALDLEQRHAALQRAIEIFGGEEVAE